MFKKFTNASVKLVQRYLPDAFIFCIILTIIVLIAVMPVTGQNFLEVCDSWGGGVWALLGFSMQMVLVLVLGTAFASAPPIKKGIQRLAKIPKTPVGAIVFVTIIASVCCWLNWGFGLVVGALLAKEVARTGLKVDYRLLIAAAYSGFLVWHAGISGSIPLKVAVTSPDGIAALTSESNGSIISAIPTSTTLFSSWNLIMIVVVVAVVAVANAFMHPKGDDVVIVDPSVFHDEDTVCKVPQTPAARLENSRLLSLAVVVIGVVYLVRYFIQAGSFNLSLNTVNMIFLLLGVLFHGTPVSYIKAINDAAKGSAGIIIQFPFYAGIMGMMSHVGPNGSSLAGAISNGFVHIASQRTFPVWTFLSAGIVNFFVPSGGGQWAVQAPIMLPAGDKLGVSQAVTCMAIAWGDAWTNMLQPFWALPALGIAGLGARDIMGYCGVILLLSGIVLILGFLFLVPVLA